MEAYILKSFLNKRSRLSRAGITHHPRSEAGKVTDRLFELLLFCQLPKGVVVEFSRPCWQQTADGDNHDPQARSSEISQS